MLITTIFLLVQTRKLVLHEEPNLSSTPQVEDEAIDLWALNFMFAIKNLDPYYGTIEATQVTWNANVGSEGKVEIPIKLVDCDELLAGGAYEGQSNNEALDVKDIFKGRQNARFLCPVEVEEMTLQGDYGTENFSYVAIRVNSCIGDNCATRQEVATQSV